VRRFNVNGSVDIQTKFIHKKGMYTNADYDEYRHFMELGRNDNAKIILTKIETR
jgi:hypothetical protein